MRLSRILALPPFVAFALMRALPLQAAAPSCSRTTPELDQALDAVHAARDGALTESQHVVKQWLPRTNRALASKSKVLEGWLHLAVDLARQLRRLGRIEEARTLFIRVAEIDAKGLWGKMAADHVKELESP
jgi:hypothetical protein